VSENERPNIGHLFSTWSRATFHPGALYAGDQPERRRSSPLVFALSVSVFAGFVVGHVERGMSGAIGALVPSLIVTIFWVYATAALVHVGLIVFRGFNGAFRGTVAAVCYASAPLVFGVVPVLGTVIGAVWYLVGLAIGLTHAHRVTPRRAWAATILGAGTAMPLLLALPEPGCGAPFDRESVVSALQDAAAPIRLEVSERTLFPEGRTGIFRALTEASQLLKSRKFPCVLVGGVDSMCDRESLAHHARRGRTLGPGTRDGILPGEGAGFCILTLSMQVGHRGLSPQGWMVGCALAREPHSFLQQKPTQADGLTEAFRQLRQHPIAGTRRVDRILSCQTGESFWAQEFNYAYLRNAPLMPEPLTVNVLAESLGDSGAAAGAVQLGSALHQFKKLKPAHGDAARVLIYGCADEGQVGACIIEEGR